VSDPAAGQGKNRSTSAQTRQPSRQSPRQATAKSAQNQKSALSLNPLSPKPGQPQAQSPSQYGSRPPVPMPNRGQDPRGPGGPGQDGRYRPEQAARGRGDRKQDARGPAEPPRGGPESDRSAGLTAWIRRRRTRAHLNYLPKWTARRAEPFDIGGLHWLPVPSADNRGPAIALHGSASILLALAEMSPAALRGPESADLGARLASVLTAFSGADRSGANTGSNTAPATGPILGPPPGRGGSPAAAGPRPPASAQMPYRPGLARIQLLHQVPGSAGRTRSYLVLGFEYTRELVDHAARLGQGERGLTLLVSKAAETVFATLGDPSPRGGRLGTLVPLDRPGWTRLLGALVLPGRGDLATPQSAAPAWRPSEIDALSPRFIAVTAPIGTAGQSSTWWHATSWVKRWPRSIGGLDLAACAGFLPPGVSGTASIVLGLRPGEGRRPTPTVAGYLTVSGRDAVEVELARVAAHAAADARDGFIEFCDRSHHLAFAQTLPLALGLAG
jgi:hypothetical protein